MSTVQNLDAICPEDGRAIGDHTLREWNAHMDLAHTDLPYEENPEPVAIPDQELVVADTVTARAAVQTYDMGRTKALVPVLILDFSLGQMGAPRSHQVSVGFISTPEMMRKVGKILRDSAHGAANAAERAAV